MMMINIWIQKTVNWTRLWLSKTWGAWLAERISLAQYSRRNATRFLSGWAPQWKANLVSRERGPRLLSQLCPKGNTPLDLPWLPLHHPNFAIYFFFCNQQVPYCPAVLSFIVNVCKKGGGGGERRKRKKIPQCYNLVLSVNQTFPVMLIACVSLMYFILLKSFETLQLSSYRPLCGYH